jgi:hypothetical protein
MSGRTGLQSFLYVISRVHVGLTPPRTSPASRKEEEDGRCPTSTGRRRHRGKTTGGEEDDATSDLFSKYSDTTLVTYV